MLPSINQLRYIMKIIISEKQTQGHVVDGLETELTALDDSYDAMVAFAKKLSDLPLRDDWEYVEPNDLDEIWSQCDTNRPLGAIADVNLDDCAQRVEAGFLGSVCGCILGKPVEINPTLADLRTALEATGDWPLNDYFSEKTTSLLPKQHNSWVETSRENIKYVAPDDDINYTIMGMLLLENHGIDFTLDNIRKLWLDQLPPYMAWGPERMMILKSTLTYLHGGDDDDDYDYWTRVLNPGDEQCGALIRADAYGYACPARPALAAELAFRDASFTHRRTGLYGTMYIAAAIACAPVTKDPLVIFDTALKFVPRRSRFYKIVADSLSEVSEATDWLDGYNRIHSKYKQYTHCKIYQEVGTLINTLKFAENVGHGICIQVSQGNDTDSFGATAGSILGCYFGPNHLKQRWLDPFNDVIHTSIGNFHEQSLTTLAKRMAQLPAKITSQLNTD